MSPATEGKSGGGGLEAGGCQSHKTHLTVTLIRDYFHSPEECTTKISHCTSPGFPSAPSLTYSLTVAAFVHSENRRETQLKTWQQRRRYIVTQSGLAALNSILGKVAFVNRHTMGSSVEGTEVDFHLLSEDTRYLPFLCV